MIELFWDHHQSLNSLHSAVQFNVHDDIEVCRASIGGLLESIGRSRSSLALLRFVACWAVISCLTGTQSVRAAVVTLYDGGNGLPSDQGWLLYGADDFGAGAASQVGTTPGVRLQTTEGVSAGYSNYLPIINTLLNPAFPVLDRTTGFELSFSARVASEIHSSNDRAGFSVLLLGSDAKGIELGFWDNEIWSQASSFSHGVGVSLMTTQNRNYALRILGDEFTLSENGNSLLTGAIQDYSAFGKAPYTLPNYLFLGDDTSSAGADVFLGPISLQTNITAVPEPSGWLILMLGIFLKRKALIHRTASYAKSAAMVLSLIAGTVSADEPTTPAQSIDGVFLSEPEMLQEQGAGEGPAWHPQLGLFTSGDGNINVRNRSGESSVHRQNAGSNGLMFDRCGRLVVCEAVRRRVTRLEKDGSTTVLADHYQGMKFNQPNDLTVDSKNRIYLTDPCYGDRTGMEMLDESGREVEGVYRIDTDGKVTRVITHEVDRPNGLVVTDNDEFLYVADNNNALGGARKLWRFRLLADGSVDQASQTLIHDWKTTRGPDGMKLDSLGRLYVAAGLNEPHLPQETAEPPTAGIYVFSPDGELVQYVRIPRDETTNCAFGGDDLRTLFVTAGGSLWSMRTSAAGKPAWPANPR